MKGWKMAIAMVGVVLVVVLLRGCVTTSYLIPSSGMENSLYRGECILVNKWSYGLRLPFMKLWGYHRWADSPVCICVKASMVLTVPMLVSDKLE